MKPGEIVPRNSRVKVVLEMVILITHEEGGQPVRENRAGSENRIGLVFQKSMLAHAANVDHGVDEEHWYEPTVEQPQPGEPPNRTRDQYGKEAYLECNP